MEFLSLQDLLEKKISHAAIANAIDDIGYLYAWDRFGRFGKYSVNDEKAKEIFKKAFDQLAYDYKYYCDPLNFEPALRDDVEGVLLGYGWPADEKISFEKYEFNKLNEPPAPKVSRKKETNELRLIYALSSCLCGEDKEDALSEVENSEASLIRFLEKRFNGYPGFSKRSLEEKFASAKNIFENS
jgi:hypothetical protein